MRTLFKKSILLFVLVFISVHSVNSQTHPPHCQAGFEACIIAAQGASNVQAAAADCVRAWLACIGYEPVVN